MKLMITFVGLLTVLGGLLPLLKDSGLLPSFLEKIPTSGIGYQAIIVAIGLIALIYGFRTRNKFLG
ncbi:MAG: hypothetical protein AABY07_09715 [Nanoarchaeota archaeon]